MADEIAPALTRSEWEDCETQQPVVALETTAGGALSVSNADAVVRVPDEYRHALAALALYQQKFGFTRADVELLDRHAQLCEVWAQTPETEQAAKATRDLMGRIAALLPPEDANG